MTILACLSAKAWRSSSSTRRCEIRRGNLRSLREGRSHEASLRMWRVPRASLPVFRSRIDILNPSQRFVGVGETIFTLRACRARLDGALSNYPSKRWCHRRTATAHAASAMSCLANFRQPREGADSRQLQCGTAGRGRNPDLDASGALHAHGGRHKLSATGDLLGPSCRHFCHQG